MSDIPPITPPAIPPAGILDLVVERFATTEDAERVADVGTDGTELKVASEIGILAEDFEDTLNELVHEVGELVDEVDDDVDDDDVESVTDWNCEVEEETVDVGEFDVKGAVFLAEVAEVGIGASGM
ncbi:hypothetical protein HWV62_10913 [Athelia sp. TMB]|nr:hypothetical protein HWV62_10913 [Athelia sp. TMB]